MNNQTIEVLQTMAYVNRNNVAYELPSTYLDPVLELVEAHGDIDKVTYKLYKPTTINDSTKNRVIAYPRLVLEAPLNIVDKDKQMKIAFLYALDKAEPIFKSAIGTELFSCTNLTLVGESSVSASSSYSIVLKDLKSQLESAKAFYNSFNEFKDKNENNILTEGEVQELLGRCILNNLRNGSSELNDYVVKGFNGVLNDESSSYFQSSDYNKWQLFNSTTQAITDKAKAFANKYYDRLTPTYKLYNLFNEIK